MDIWMKNTRLLKNSFPECYARTISRDFHDPNMRITESAADNTILQTDHSICYLHSRYSVEREMEELFRDTGDPEQNLIIFGLGMGHCFDYIRQKRIKYKQILVLEPFNNIFTKLLQKRHMNDFLSNIPEVSIHLFNNPREVIPFMMGNMLTSRKVKFLYHMSYRSIYKDLYQEISRLFENEKRGFMMSTYTMNYFITEWTKHQVISIGKNQLNASILNNKFQNVPAIIISAGPSLEKRVDELKEIGNKAVLIAPGTSVKICTKMNISAHLAMAIDSQQAEAELMRNSNIGILVGSYRLHPDVDDLFPNQVLKTVLSNENLAQYYHNYSDLGMDIISDHASVSCCAVEYAASLGCNPIILVGQDLCYYDRREHAGEESGSMSESVGTAREELDINGEKVSTDEGFLGIRRDMELVNVKYQDRMLMLNATEAGLGIPGVRNVTLREVIDQYISTQEVDVARVIDEIINNEATVLENRSKNVDEFYQHLLNEIDDLNKLNIAKAGQLEKLESMLRKGFKGNRLDGQVYYLREIDSKMQESKFWQEVIAPTLDRFLVFHQAGVRYAFDQPDDPMAVLYYETKVYNYTNRYLNIIKDGVEKQVNGSIPDDVGESQETEENAVITLPSMNLE